MLERASGTHKNSVQPKLSLLTSTCSVVYLLSQDYYIIFYWLRLTNSVSFRFVSSAQRKGMVIKMNPITVNGTAIPSPDMPFKWSLNDISYEDSGRDLNGTMDKDEVAKKITLDCTWSHRAAASSPIPTTSRLSPHRPISRAKRRTDLPIPTSE